MTEKQWHECADPWAMLYFLSDLAVADAPGGAHGTLAAGEAPPARPSGRKVRLFSCACVRRLWHLLDDQRCGRLIEACRLADAAPGREGPPPPPDCCRRAVELAERSADEPVPYEEAEGLNATVRGLDLRASGRAERYAERAGPIDAELWASSLVVSAVEHATDRFPLPLDPNSATLAGLLLDGSAGVVRYSSAAVAYASGVQADPAKLEGDPAERAAQCELLRDVIGNPFRPVAMHPSWLTANVLSLARVIYEERAFERLPVLADALTDAGCSDEDVLGHCRSAGPHVRGCWVVDLLLGKG